MEFEVRFFFGILHLLKSMHITYKTKNNCMDNALSTLCKVRTGYVSGTMRSMLPQHRKKEREQENVMSLRLLFAMVNAEFKKGDKNLFILYERKPKHSLKPQYHDK